MLHINHITKTYEGTLLLRDLSLTIERGEIVCLLGPSGSGKTTLLRIIAGLENTDSGDIIFDNVNLRDKPTHLRQFGMMFQDLGLFPHKNVFENVAFGLRMQNYPRAEINARVQETMQLVGLSGFEKRNVNNLSGGEQQRVALARSLAPRPRLLMFDEPLGALDRILREQLVSDLRTILKRIGMTALYVTHDQDEAFAIADRIAIIHAGRIAQIDTPDALYRSPANTFVAQFLGLTNLYPARRNDAGQIETMLGAFDLEMPPHVEDAVLLIRPNGARIGAPGIAARVEECVFRGGKYRVRVATERGAQLSIETERALATGSTVSVQIDAAEWIAK